MNLIWPTLSLLAAFAATGCRIERSIGSDKPSGARGPEQLGLAFLSKEVPRWHRENKCYSCHNNGDAARALFTASALGHRIPKDALADTAAWLQEPENWDNNKGDPAFSDKRLATIQFTSALDVGLRTKCLPDRRALLIAARRLIREQDQDGAWRIEPATALGSPATYGTPLATAMAANALRDIRNEQVEEACLKAERWLRQSPAQNVLEAAAISMGLAGREDSLALARRQECLDLIRRAQTADGGWGPYADSPPEPFDTAVVLLALRKVGRPSDSEILVKRGREFLVRTQLSDGSWPETTRPPRGESYAQRISTTGWATLALLQTTSDR